MNAGAISPLDTAAGQNPTRPLTSEIPAGRALWSTKCSVVIKSTTEGELWS